MSLAIPTSKRTAEEIPVGIIAKRTRFDTVWNQASLRIFSDLDHVEGTAVYVNESDLKNVPYVEIYNALYQVRHIKDISRGLFAVSPDTYNDLEASGSVFYPGSEGRVISYKIVDNPPLLDAVSCELSPHKQMGAPVVSPIVLDINHLKYLISLQFTGKPLSFEKNYLVSYPLGHFKLKCKEINYGCPPPYGVVNIDTRFQFTLPKISPFILVDQIVNDPLAPFHFRITIDEIFDPQVQVPLIINCDELNTELKKRLGSIPIAIGSNIRLNYYTSQGVLSILNLELIKVPSPYNPIDANVSFKRYHSGYTLTATNPIHFEGMDTVILTKEEPLKADKISFDINQFIPNNNPSILFKNSILIQELKAKLLEQPFFLKREKITLFLDRGKVFLQVKKIEKSLKPEVSIKRFWKKRYVITTAEQIDFNVRPIVNLNLIESHDPLPLKKLEVAVKSNSKSALRLNKDDLTTTVRSFFNKGCLEKQKVSVKLTKGKVDLIIKSLAFEDSAIKNKIGEIKPETEIEMKLESVNLSFDSEEKTIARKPHDIIEFLEERGLSGFTPENEEVLRELDAARGKNKDLIKQAGFKLPKAILLYGPPGTGKTTLCKIIAEWFEIPEERQTIVNANSEVMSMWQGESEKNAANLFKKAENSYQSNKKDPDLHLVIFDEFDSLASKRGNPGSASHDATVGTLLAKIDGLNKNDNFLIFANTNRIDNVDPAFLRPGRFEKTLEMGIPKEKERKKIFNVHLRKIADHLDTVISVSSLASLTENCSGAEIEAIIKQAFFDFLKERDSVSEKNKSSVKITQENLVKAIEKRKPRTEKVTYIT